MKAKKGTKSSAGDDCGCDCHPGHHGHAKCTNGDCGCGCCG